MNLGGRGGRKGERQGDVDKVFMDEVLRQYFRKHEKCSTSLAMKLKLLEILSYPSQKTVIKKSAANSSKDVGKREPFTHADGNVNLSSHYANRYRACSKT